MGRSSKGHGTTKSNGINLWHKRFGHASKDAIEDMSRKDLVTGINLNQVADAIDCSPCVEGKQT